MSVKTFTEEFKIEAVTEINEQGYPLRMRVDNGQKPNLNKIYLTN